MCLESKLTAFCKKFSTYKLLLRWLPDGHGEFSIDEDRQASEQDVVNITDAEYKGFWITVNEVGKPN